MQVIGVDTGGTFTDFVYYDGQDFKIHKVQSTPDDPSAAILSGLRNFFNQSGQKPDVVHGTTVATNALLERKGARVLLITTKGFEDILEIGRQNRDTLYDLFIEKSPPLVPSELRIGITERINYKGEILEEIETTELHDLVKNVDSGQIDTIAICFINSYSNPEHEIKAAEIVKKLNISTTLSSTIVPEFREYERTSTTVVNSYLIPKVKKYMSSLTEKLEGVDVKVMQSNGGIISPEQAGNQPVRIITSGPAGGVVGAYKLCSQIGINNLITYDMGGTSTDISLCDKNIRFTTQCDIDGVPIKTTMIDILTIGAGGGSIAYADRGGALKVGPESSGADPGPACYGNSNIPTVTDANLVLGRIPENSFLGGRMKIKKESSLFSLNKLAKNFKINEYLLAETIVNVANSNMEKAIKVISVEKGYDPRDFTLVSFGGSGGLHACQLAANIGIRQVVFPLNPGVLSAMGMLLADSFKDYSKGFFHDCENINYGQIDEQFKLMEENASVDLNNSKLEYERYLDARYKNQSHELTVNFGPNFIEDFNNLHHKRYGFKNTEKPVEIVTLRLKAFIGRSKHIIKKYKKSKKEIFIGKTEVYMENGFHNVDTYRREDLYPDLYFKGPCIVLDDTSTIYIPYGFKCLCDDYGNIISSDK